MGNNMLNWWLEDVLKWVLLLLFGLILWATALCLLNSSVASRTVLCGKVPMDACQRNSYGLFLSCFSNMHHNYPLIVKTQISQNAGRRKCRKGTQEKVWPSKRQRKWQRRSEVRAVSVKGRGDCSCLFKKTRHHFKFLSSSSLSVNDSFHSSS